MEKIRIDIFLVSLYDKFNSINRADLINFQPFNQIPDKKIAIYSDKCKELVHLIVTLTAKADGLVESDVETLTEEEFNLTIEKHFTLTTHKQLERFILFVETFIAYHLESVMRNKYPINDAVESVKQYLNLTK